MSDNQNASPSADEQNATASAPSVGAKKSSKPPVARPSRPSVEDIKAMGLDAAPYGDQPKKKV